MTYTATPGTYWIEQGTDGTEDTFTILAPNGTALADVFFWDSEPASRATAEAKAKWIVDALNAHYGDTLPALPDAGEPDGRAEASSEPLDADEIRL